MKILVINGPNINLLGIREPKIYGNRSYSDLLSHIKNEAEKLDVEVEFYQSNHEGDLVDAIQSALGRIDGIIINPAAYAHSSIAILDALKAVDLPTIEVHLSNPGIREEFRHVSITRRACLKSICGRGFEGYIEALHILTDKEPAVSEK
ncbi:MAG: type II 3-dehydroquinate dehydratase [Oscillospiraceae bacterium]